MLSSEVRWTRRQWNRAHEAQSMIDRYENGITSVKETALVGTSIKECIQQFEAEDTLDANQKKYFDSCILMRVSD